MTRGLTCLLGAALLLAPAGGRAQDDAKDAEDDLRLLTAESVNWQLPHEKWKLPFKDEIPIVFVTTQNQAEWKGLARFWNETTETAIDPLTGAKVERKVVKLKVPLGLSQPPKVPAENPITVQRWALGKKLYFDPVLSADQTVSCASCHDPKRGYTDQLPVSIGVRSLKGGVSAPTVLNSAYHVFQFWDGRASSLEDQAQGPVANPIEMANEKDSHAWPRAVYRVRKKGTYADDFKKAFGTEPTRDAIAKAIATYERTVLSGNSVHDRAEAAMRVRVTEEEGTDFTVKPEDYEKVLNEAFANDDAVALKALQLKDKGRVAEFAKKISNGRALFFNKARCSQCHVGENFTDNSFHNLGVGIKGGGAIDPDLMGRFARLPVGHKDVQFLGAFKTPTVRGLVGTGPYMHNGSEKTLEDVVEFYDKGGNPNEFLSPKLRDLEAERSYLMSKQNGGAYNGPKVQLFGPDQKPVVPFKLNLSKEEKADLVLFLRALQGDDPDPIVADPERGYPNLSANKE